MNIDIRAIAGITGLTAAACAAVVLAAPTALADPQSPDQPPAPEVVVNQAAAPDAAPVAAPAAVPAEVPHISSPENLPPGTTAAPINEGPRTSFLRGIWQAVQSDDLTWQDGLMMLAQRPMDAAAAPPPGVPAGPQQQGPIEPPAPTPVPTPAPAPAP